jgi:hypothetical protein
MLRAEFLSATTGLLHISDASHVVFDLAYRAPRIGLLGGLMVVILLGMWHLRAQVDPIQGRARRDGEDQENEDDHHPPSRCVSGLCTTHVLLLQTPHSQDEYRSSITLVLA